MTEMQENICAVYGKGTETNEMCQKWFTKFHAGGFLVENPARSGRPVKVNSDQIETLIENNQCYTTWEIADIL